MRRDPQLDILLQPHLAKAQAGDRSWKPLVDAVGNLAGPRACDPKPS
jgi:hypothetical protein